MSSVCSLCSSSTQLPYHHHSLFLPEVPLPRTMAVLLSSTVAALVGFIDDSKSLVCCSRSLFEHWPFRSLVAPYCAIPRDYLSDTPLSRAMGFSCLNMANWVRYPLPLFSAFPPWRACKVEVRYPPPSKEVSQRYLRDTL